MASGSYLNNSRTPAGYGIYERLTVGALQPRVIDATGTYSLQAMQSDNEGLRLETATRNQFFLIENRQQQGWDTYLPGHGMLVWRVDSTDTYYWENNWVNYYKGQNQFELMRATNSDYATDDDPFPGTAQVHDLGNAYSKPTLRNRLLFDSPFVFSQIQENNGQVTFQVNAVDTGISTVVEDFEQMPLTGEDAESIPGNFCDWDLTQATVGVLPGNDFLTGKGVAMMRNGSLQTCQPMSLSSVCLYLLSYSLKPMVIRCEFSNDGGDTWELADDNSQHIPNVIMEPENFTAVRYPNPLDGEVLVRFSRVGGNADDPLYLDDVTFVFDRVAIAGDVNGDGLVDVTDVNIIINIMLGKR